MTIRNMVRLGALLLVALLAFGAFMANSRINEIRIGGPLASQNQIASDLVADILPPPAFIIEPYLEATSSVEDIERSAPHLRKLMSLKKDYLARRDLWLSAGLPTPLHNALQHSFEQSDLFWDEIDNRFAPAVRRLDLTAAQHSHDQVINPLFKKHREAIDLAVKEAANYQRSLVVESQEHLLAAIMLLSSIGLAVLAGVCGFCWFMLARVVRPISTTALTMRAMSEGDLSLPIVGEQRSDEMGDVARALVSFRQAEIDKRDLEEARVEAQKERAAIIEELSVALRHLANGNVSYRIETMFSGQYEELRQDFNSALTAMASALRAVAEASTAIRNGSGEIAQESDDLSVRTEQQAAALEETSASMTTATGSVRETASNAEEANLAVRETHEAANKGGEIVHDAIAAMDEIEKSSNQIGQIISLIDNVAFQTNLLALNAAVEAARAGEAGDGFAVVAAEVRGLAQRTADAANDVKHLITSSAQQVANGVRLVGQAGETLDHIVERVNRITTLVEEITSSVREESLVLVQVNSAVGEMDRMTQQNAAMVEQSTAAARNLASEAVSLAALVDNFKIDMPKNDQKIRTLAEYAAQHSQAA